MRIVRLLSLRRLPYCCRSLSAPSKRPPKSQTYEERRIEEARDEAEFTPTHSRVKIFWYSASRFKRRMIVLGVALGTYLYVLNWVRILKAKKEHEEEITSTESKVYGELAVGGPFEMKNTKGEVVSSETLKGKWVLLYFGFTYCPDICPEQMELMGDVTEILKTEHGIEVVPLMITIDLERDTPEVLDSYLADYHPSIQALLGTDEQLDSACNHFRCYRSKGKSYDDPSDYILDHTVTQYIINPAGKTVGYFMSTRGLEERVPIFLGHYERYKALTEQVEPTTSEKLNNLLSQVVSIVTLGVF